MPINDLLFLCFPIISYFCVKSNIARSKLIVLEEDKLNKLTYEIIGAAIEVHSILGPGYKENVYKRALAHELTLRGLSIEVEAPIYLIYKGVRCGDPFRADIIVEKSIILELKAAEPNKDLFAQQLNSYLKMSGLKVGLLLNFRTERMRDGITRVLCDKEK